MSRALETYIDKRWQRGIVSRCVIRVVSERRLRVMPEPHHTDPLWYNWDVELDWARTERGCDAEDM